MKSIKKTSTPNNKTQGAPLVSIDYPQEGELVRQGAYAIRVSAMPEAEVEICVNDIHWLPCRFSVGYWWYDWHPSGTDRQKMVARARAGNGRWSKSEPRTFAITTG